MDGGCGMPSEASRLPWLDALLRLFSAAGLVVAAAGVALDLLPGAHPGVSLPQLLLIVAGLALSLCAGGLRRAELRRWLRKNLAAALLISLITLLALEALLAALDYKLYYPPGMLDLTLELPRWRTCDEAGCHFVPESAMEACGPGQESRRRRCRLNPQGFSDTQAFVANEDLDQRERILILGDSFAYGMSAAFGSSYVETLERLAPERVVWNTAVPGSGTHQALANFEVYAPLLQPQATILGFYMNDFRNNMLSLSDWHTHADPREATAVTWRDGWGHDIQLDRHSAFVWRQAGMDPPASEMERLVGGTRLGSLALAALDAVERARINLDGGNSPLVDTTRGYLRSLRDAAKAQGTALLALLIPRPGDIGNPGALYVQAANLMRELDIDYLDPLAALDAELDYADDEHWNDAGHQKIGRLLDACLRDFAASGDFSGCAA